jgi:hypothetical protein
MRLGALQSRLALLFIALSGCVWRQMWTAPIEMLPPAWARVNLDAVTAVHPFPTSDSQVEIAADSKVYWVLNISTFDASSPVHFSLLESTTVLLHCKCDLLSATSFTLESMLNPINCCPGHSVVRS